MEKQENATAVGPSPFRLSLAYSTRIISNMDKLLRLENNIQSETTPVCYKVRLTRCSTKTLPYPSTTLPYIEY
jgi:hypothetical protein